MSSKEKLMGEVGDAGAGHRGDVPHATGLLLVDARIAAKRCGVSRSTWWSLHSAGKVPLPVRLGRRTLWRAAELESWTAAGCPARDRWETRKGVDS